MMTLGGPIFTWMTNEIDQDVISLSAGPDCNRRHGVRHRQSAEEDEEAGAARINFEFHAASGDLGEEGGASGAATDRYSSNSYVGIFWPSIKITERGRQRGFVIKRPLGLGVL